MRFGLARSPSPSPVREMRSRPLTSSLGLFRGGQTNNGDDDDSQSRSVNYESEEQSGLSSSSDDDDDDDRVPRAWKTASPTRRTLAKSFQSTSTVSPQEQRQLEEALASIRLRSRHNDPYEEWERKVRKESFKTARKNYATVQAKLHDDIQAAKTRDDAALQQGLQRQRQAFDQRMLKLREKQEADTAAMRSNFRKRDEALWKYVEDAIALDTNKAETLAAAERKLRDEVEKKRKDEEVRQQLEEEKKRAAEAKKRADEEAKKKADEEQKRRDEEQAQKIKEEMERVEAEKKAKMEKAVSEKGARDELGFSVAQDDWWTARKFMASLKSDIMPLVKNKDGTTAQLKADWSTHRRQMTPKFGQLTGNMNDVTRISNAIVQIMMPPSAHNQTVYYGLLSSLAKAIIEQCETEVSMANAESNPALPLAHLTFNLLERLEGFEQVLWAHLVTRTGGWAVPYPIGDSDWDGRKWANHDEYKKAIGYRQMETNDGSMIFENEEQYNTRITAIMRVYFSVLAIKPTRGPLKGAMWQTPMFWRWTARLLGSDGGGRVMLEKAIAADALAAGLQVLGSDAKAIWGHQFVKVLALVHEGITVGFGDNSGIKIGGPAPEGSAARLRLQIEIERIMAS